MSSSNKGMSLIEIMVTLFILSVMMISIYSMLNLNFTVFAKEDRDANIRKEVRKLIDQILKDIQSAQTVAVDNEESADSEIDDEDNDFEIKLTYLAGSPIARVYQLSETFLGSNTYTLSITDDGNSWTNDLVFVKKVDGKDFFEAVGGVNGNYVVNMEFLDRKNLLDSSKGKMELSTTVTPRIEHGLLKTLVVDNVVDGSNLTFNSDILTYSIAVSGPSFSSNVNADVLTAGDFISYEVWKTLQSNNQATLVASNLPPIGTLPLSAPPVSFTLPTITESAEYLVKIRVVSDNNSTFVYKTYMIKIYYTYKST